ncbi:MAG: hypothetical protein HYX27_07755 [Acidobacteria bacterium]|nr:hypothetical protein [Acidobacteriota bacterium]
MKRFALVALAVSLAAQPAAVEMDLEARLRSAFDRVAHPVTRAQAEQVQESIRERLRLAIGIQRVSQPVRATAFFPEQSPAPAVLLLRPDCEAQGREFVRRGIAAVCIQAEAPASTADLLGGITPQGRVQNAVARVLRHLTSRMEIDRGRIYLSGQGASGVIAAALFPEFARVVVDAPSIENTLIYGIAQFATVLDLLAISAPRPLLVDHAPQPLTSALRDHFRLFDAGGQFFVGAEPLGWLAPNAGQGVVAPPQIVELPAEPAVADPRLSLQPLAGGVLPAVQMTIGLNPHRRQEAPLQTHRGIMTPVTVYRPGPDGADPERGRLLAISDDGRASLENDEVVQEAIRRNWMVLAADPRGIGDMRLRDSNRVAISSFQLGEWLAWRQATEVARMIDFAGRPTANLRSAVYARGPNATLIAALLAATAQSGAPEMIALRDPLPSLKMLPPGPLAPFYTAFDMETLLPQARAKVIIVRDVAELSWLVE